jgi:translocation and assembly module TamB
MALRLLRWLLIALFVLAVLSAALVAGALWYGHTQDALERAVAQAVERSGGRLQIEGASGSALGPFAFARIAWTDGATAIVAERVRGEWSPLSLLSRRLQVGELGVARLTIASAGQGQAGGLPESLALPLPLAIDRLTIAILELSAEGTVIDASGIELGYLGDETGHHMRGLRVNSPVGAIGGDVDLGLQAPYAVAGKLSLARADPRRPIAASATLRGDLGRLMLEVQATVGSAQISGAGTLRPGEPSWLQSLSLKGSAVDLAQLEAAWPRTDLTVAGSAATTASGHASPISVSLSRGAASHRAPRRSVPHAPSSILRCLQWICAPSTARCARRGSPAPSERRLRPTASPRARFCANGISVSRSISFSAGKISSCASSARKRTAARSPETAASR